MQTRGFLLRDNVIYLKYFIHGQIIPALKSPIDIENYECASGKVKLIVPIYKATTGEFRG